MNLFPPPKIMYETPTVIPWQRPLTPLTAQDHCTTWSNRMPRNTTCSRLHIPRSSNWREGGEEGGRGGGRREEGGREEGERREEGGRGRGEYIGG